MYTYRDANGVALAMATVQCPFCSLTFRVALEEHDAVCCPGCSRTMLLPMPKASPMAAHGRIDTERDILAGLVELRDALPSQDDRLDNAIDYLRDRVGMMQERH